MTERYANDMHLNYNNKFTKRKIGTCHYRGPNGQNVNFAGFL